MQIQFWRFHFWIEQQKEAALNHFLTHQIINNQLTEIIRQLTNTIRQLIVVIIKLANTFSQLPNPQVHPLVNSPTTKFNTSMSVS